MPSVWTQHIAAYRAAHPGVTFKQALTQASASYRRASPATNVNKATRRIIYGAWKGKTRVVGRQSNIPDVDVNLTFSAGPANDGTSIICSIYSAGQRSEVTYISYERDTRILKNDTSDPYHVLMLKIKREMSHQGAPAKLQNDSVLFYIKDAKSADSLERLLKTLVPLPQSDFKVGDTVKVKKKSKPPTWVTGTIIESYVMGMGREGFRIQFSDGKKWKATAETMESV